MTLDDIIAGLFDREGRTYAEPPATDQPTGPGGITLPVLAAYRGRPCTIADLKALTVTEATALLRSRLEGELAHAGFNRIGDEHLRVQLLDFSWNSGESRAIRWLQRTVGLAPGFVTGTIDDRTIAALDRWPGWLVNNALAGERAHAAYHGAVRADLAPGVARRAIEFIVPLDEPMTT